MSEQESVAVAEAEAFEYPVKIEDIGPAAKKVTVEIPRDRIDTKLAEQYKELRQQAHIPGFRLGHAPQKLVEKRFANDVKDQVRRTLISESYEQALEKNSLQVIGDPQFDNPDDIKLPDDGPMSYSFEVEVKPAFTLPPVTGLKIRKPKVAITEEYVDNAVRTLREQQGTLTPVEDRGIEPGDHTLADIHVKLNGSDITHQHDTSLVIRPARIAGIQVDNLADHLTGQKPGETRAFKATAPDTHANEQIRGKEVEIEVSVKEIKKLELADLNEQFLAELGLQNEQELRDALREQMEQKVADDIQRVMRDQVNNYLLANTNVELPAKLSERQADRVVSRRSVDLMMRGMPRDQVEANLEQLRGGAAEEAARELKLFFILQQVAEEQNVDVSEQELNGRLALVAAQEGKRPEKLKQEWAKDGTLSNVYIQMREQKAVDKILDSAVIEEVEELPAGVNAPAAEAQASVPVEGGAPAESPAPEAPPAQ
ncbi:MAG TPA: trigger factor [Tepidisphaeraceae bacterium]|jgi:trigger factor|nr:trigger factor [Tepidisphaeraceae bacterium]